MTKCVIFDLIINNNIYNCSSRFWICTFKKGKTMTVKITSNQENRIADLVRDAVRALNLSKDEAQEIIKVGGYLQEQVKPILKKLAILDKRFGPAVNEFEFTVPDDYEHDTQLDTFTKKTKILSTTHEFNEDFRSKDFARATTRLTPGKTYKVKIFPILEEVTTNDCLIFLAKQNAILVSGQGITLLQTEMPEKFPVGKYTVSFDQKDALWFDSDEYHRVPCVYRNPKNSDWEFWLDYFEDNWLNYYCLLCFSEL